ncbi:peroxiredoxin, Ohr subfamily [Actinokineospora alba]|uniref:Peroxiredoxin, Ohr subfamily n=1 Tax=Actinokineospora alba TaxID=504798 RepID=A0A1H0N5I0_9PSEU|nr:organic hydroperoxide resistance protein [Actinokineospora alba]TDP68580.1 Ohr subfamily peroxiredoxin [Actinokineospora alba]SDH82208.1 peroxiredoxin, Ohr subfamily [Actinokineospora alba]SDO87974.1 peroxiredoxin, Ohr subfamily [Actinokineospora alba]
MQALYEAKATATGSGRGGRVLSSDGALTADLAVPTSLGGPGGGTNPEQLFAAGYAACFHSALQLVARKAKVRVQDSQVSAVVGLGAVEGGYGLSVTLEISVPEVERSTVDELVAAAHQVCPYSNATRGNIDVDLVVV